MYEAKLSRHLQVSIRWTIFTTCPALREEKEIAQKIAWQVFELTSVQLGTSHVSWEDVNDPLFTRYGIEISVHHINGVGKSCWSSVACFGFPPEAERIQDVLDQKDSKVIDYRKACDKVWLVIVADGNFFSSQFTPESCLAEMKFNSSFDRVFLIEEPQYTVHEFQIAR